jgi:hypothetical protein
MFKVLVFTANELGRMEEALNAEPCELVRIFQDNSSRYVAVLNVSGMKKPGRKVQDQIDEQVEE